ncbi:Holliday junction resolvase RuvX [Wenzhouxiangella sp. AB-CW3]|uniref:Holliday junction resolvase RuvX n=1 Tax=Wenzhouxiangella sp. AB-CW3 TaxID=2771012 RepID=UPI00168ADD7B|nr:Holliday junction resolvase RuvX [Wenzhouxiangella sp. AB-CW3]QOC22969.1 Holliday junction resolvase RuvX [Wenzhouxiangella sp. AB-CW3]
MPERASGALIGIDFGTRKVGVALGHSLTGSARPLEPVRYTDQSALLAGIEAVLNRWRPECVVIGLPLTGEGGESDMTRKVRDFAADLAERQPGLQIEFHDERMTSLAAADAFAGRRKEGRARKRDARLLDSMAAALILESWMAEHA